MEGKLAARIGLAETWFVKNAGWLALGIIAAAFLMRLFFACACYLNPDEAQHFDAARATSWLAAYEASRHLAHPPLFILVLHATLFLGRSEPIIRMPSLIGGTAALGFTYAWLRRSLGEIPALAGLGFMALSPAAISASTEVRQYGVLLFFVCGAIYALERTLSERSTHWAMIHGLFMLGAVMTYYTAVLVLLCLGVYSWIRLVSDRMPRRLALTIGGCQLALALVIGLLYFGHIRQEGVFGAASLNYLQQYYFAKTRETPLGYAWRAISETFRYASGRSERIPVLLAVLAGTAIVLTGRSKAPRVMAFLVISPFIAGFAASIYRVFPFAGSRHEAYLTPFFAAGIAAAFAIVHHKLVVPLLLAGALIAPLWVKHIELDNDWRVMPLRDMTSAIDYLRRTVPQATPLFVDGSTRFEFAYYLSRNDPSVNTLMFQSGVEVNLFGGWRVVTPRGEIWAFDPSEVFDQADQLARGVGLLPGDPVWIVSVDWANPSFVSQLPARSDYDVKKFGLVSAIQTRYMQQGPAAMPKLLSQLP